MHSLKKMFTYGLMMFALSFGLTVPATAAFENTKIRAEQGNIFDQRYLGVLYSNGIGVGQDHEKALYWFKKAADQGDAGGQFYVGHYYVSGLGVKRDYTQALYWLRKSASQNDGFAQSHLASMYQSGQGVRQDKSVAKEWYGKACDNGFQSGCDNYRKLNEQGY